MKRLFAFVTLALMVSAASCASSTPTATKATTSAASTEVPSSVGSGGACADLVCKMTKDSGVYGVPLPDDATPEAGKTIGLQSSHVATIEQLTSFYKDYMVAKGWTFDASHSTLDPDQAKAEELGYVSDAVYCKSTIPITTVGVIVGNVGDVKGGTALEISIQDDPGETSCP